MAAVSPVARGLSLGTAAIWVALELRQSLTHRPEGVLRHWGNELVFRLAVVAGAVLATVFSRAGGATLPGFTAWVGLALLWSGIGLRLWSFRTLGRYFTFIVQTTPDQPVISDGPYRVIRHPSYAGLLLVIMGVGVLIGNWWSLISLTIAVACGLVFRIRVEERALLQDLGSPYRTYAASHKRLIPFVW